ncbi:MAG: hypothetical protein Q7S04_01225 [Candidatus Moranbacteria bacterium]|nr:hypothetical protein [Candidatus Moranbacteria bacterium]
MTPSPYQDFVRKAKERFAARQKIKASGTGVYQFTRHAEYKMQQYGLSGQRVRSVIRHPKRREEGIVPKTVAVMQPTSVKTLAGKPVWKQEIWVLFQIKNSSQNEKLEKFKTPLSFGGSQLKIISAWRYPGVSPKRNPIPEEILRELEEGSVIETEEAI